MNTGNRHIKGRRSHRRSFPVFLLILVVHLMCLSLVVPASANELLILQSGDLQPYHEAAEGVLASLNIPGNRQGPKALLAFTVDTMVLNTDTDDDGWWQILKQRRPRTIVAIGKRALELAVQLPDVPIIHVMVPGAEQIIGLRENVRGISMVISPAIILESLQIHYPSVHRIVVLYHPVYSDKFIREAEAAARQLGFELVAIPTESPQEVDRLLNSVQTKVQALWMIADPNVLNAQTIQTFLDYSIQRRVLLLTFAEKYLKTGATFAVAADTTEMGRQAGRMVVELLEGKEDLPGAPKNPTAYRVFKNVELLDRIANLDALPVYMP
jgi:putative tryptophan/tyrosine transport system substrate-binding protein